MSGTYIKISIIVFLSAYGVIPVKTGIQCFSLFWIPAGACPRENVGGYDGKFLELGVLSNKKPADVLLPVVNNY